MTDFFVYDPHWKAGKSELKAITRLRDDHRFFWQQPGRGGKTARLLDDSITPSLTLNNPKAIPSTWTTLSILCLGILLQAAVIVMNWVVVYRWRKLRAGKVVASWGYPVWGAGTIGISIGVMICAYVANGKTTTGHLKRHRDCSHLQIFRVQKALEKEGIPGYIIQHDPGNLVLIWSVTKWHKQPWLIAFGTLVALGGFVCQNIGTRELHWSAGIAQLGVTVALTALRAQLRRHVGDELKPTPQKVDDSSTCALPFYLKQWKCWTPRYIPRLSWDTDGYRLFPYLEPGVEFDKFDVSTQNYESDVQVVNELLAIWSEFARLQEDETIDEIENLAGNLVETMKQVFRDVTGS